MSLVSSLLFISLSLFIGENGIEIDLPEIEPARSIDFVSLEAPSYIIDGYWSGVELDSYNMPKDSIPERTFIRLDGDFSCPYGKVVYSPYGRRFGRFHNGVDLPLPQGTSVTAAFSGVVRLSTYRSGYGHIIIIRHANGIETAYAHLSKRKVNSGDVVKTGDIIAISGSSGRSTGPHLHFETLYCGHTFNPELIIDFEKGTLVQSPFMLRRDFLQ